MPSNVYITKQGDTWDIVARNVYGSDNEKLAGFLQTANTSYVSLLYFPAGIRLAIPATPAAATAIPAPWERQTPAELDPVGKLVLDYAEFVKGTGADDHSRLSHLEAAQQHPTSAICHGPSKRPLDQIIDQILITINAGGGDGGTPE